MHKFYLLTGLSGPVFFRTLIALILTGLALVPAMTRAMLLPTAQLMVDTHSISAEIAATDESRSRGLMQRQSLPPDHGMLFVFQEVGKPCFWMKNTPLRLSIAFIDAQGVIVNIADMQAHSLDSHCPAGPVVYALEMEQGWFRQHQVKAGASVKNLPRP